MENLSTQKVIVRTEKAGVFYGVISERNGNEVVMKNVRRLWKWYGAFTLSELSSDGTLKPKDCRFTKYVDEMTILGVIEIIPCTDKAIKSIESVKDDEQWK